MITYCFTNLPGISPSDRYGILVCLSGEENIVRDLAKWFSEQTKNGENTNAFYELLNKSEIRVDVYCVEFFFYFLGLYLTSIAKSNEDISSILEFVDIYITKKKDRLFDVSLDSISRSSIMLLNEDLLNIVSSEKKPAFSSIISKLKDFDEISYETLERIVKKDYNHLLLMYLYDSLSESIENWKPTKILMTARDNEFFKEYRDKRKNDDEMVFSILEDQEVLPMIESTCYSILEALKKVYERNDESITIPSGLSELLTDNVFQRVWMASSWTVSYFL